jgi:hypothetical protein
VLSSSARRGSRKGLVLTRFGGHLILAWGRGREPRWGVRRIIRRSSDGGFPMAPGANSRALEAFGAPGCQSEEGNGLADAMIIGLS